ncbi:MAG: hypothetical protein U0T82_04470 [Bacteroidales bacterium]
MPCVNQGQYHTSISGTTIWLGFVHISNLEAAFAQEIIRERESRGPFTGLADFLERIPAGLEQLILLIRCNAFRFTGKSKKELLWEVHMLLGTTAKKNIANSLFGIPAQDFVLPPLVQEHAEDAFDEMELLGFPVSISHFDLLQTSFRGEVMASGMTAQLGRRVRMLGNLVTIKNVRTVKKEWMHFGCFLDARGEFFDTVHFPPSLARYPFRGQGVYLLLGRVVEEFGFPSLEVEKMAKMPFVKDPRYM